VLEGEMKKPLMTKEERSESARRSNETRRIRKAAAQERLMQLRAEMRAAYSERPALLDRIAELERQLGEVK